MLNKRMHIHDYTRPGFYMITIITAGRKPLFGVCRNNRVQLSTAGEIVKRRWLEIPLHRPAIETNTLVVMPDHLHGIVYVRERLEKPVGLTIRGFKSGATSELRRCLNDSALEVWEEAYHDRVIMNSETLRAERRYIRDNPRRYTVRKAHPELFVTMNSLRSPRLPEYMDWSGFGNLFLLEKPDMMPVKVSRNAGRAVLADMKEQAIDLAWRGTVMVSPFISPGEKEIARCIMQQQHGSLVLIKPDGFPSVYKPSGTYFDLCALGRLLVLSPFLYTGRKQALTRERCLQMNRLVEEICGNSGQNTTKDD